LYDDYDQVDIRGDEESSGLFSPFTFLVVALVLTLFGLLMLYSSSFNYAIENSLKHYHFLFFQVGGLFLGLALGLVLRLLPINILKKSHYVFSFAAIALVIAYFVIGDLSTPYIKIGSKDIFNIPTFIIFSSILSFSATMSEIKKSDRFGILYALAIIYHIAFAILCGCIGGIAYYVIYAICIISMIIPLGFKRSYAILAVLFALVLGLCLCFLVPAIFENLASSIFPVSNAKYYKGVLYSSLNAIKEGGIAGSGIGKGIFKLMNYRECISSLIFTTVFEELGLIGAVFSLFLIILFYIVALRTMKRAYDIDSFIAASSFALSLSIIIPFILSILTALGIFPYSDIYMPFFSYSPSVEAITVATAYLIYKEVFIIGRRRDDD